MYMGYVVIFLAHTLQALILLSCAHAADCPSLHFINVAIRAFWHQLKLLLHTSYCSFGNMKEWLRARDLFDFFTEVNMKPCEWARDPKNPDIHKKEVWFKCLLNEKAIHPSLCFNEKGIGLGIDGKLIMTSECQTISYNAQPLGHVSTIVIVGTST